MKTHQEIRDEIEKREVYPYAHSPWDILHALNDRIELMHKAQQLTVHGCEELTNVVGDLEKRIK